MKILVINGPNLNMLGIREPDIYGRRTYDDLVSYIKEEAAKLGVETEFYQSNHEGDIVDKIQSVYGNTDGIVINPAAYTHTSVAIPDAIKAVGIPTVEVHISDINSREAFRRISYVSPVCIKTIAGKGFEGYAIALSELAKYKDNPAVLAEIEKIKTANKADFAKRVKAKTGIELDPNSIFDVQVKRLHEYKRQHLNALNILAKYLAIKANPSGDFMPHTYIFGAKAASGYFMAKKIISFICALADLINNDPDVKGRLKVVYMEDYNVSMAEYMMPAADVSEQISLAGTEASGTGNMKLMMNGAITLGTLDGANVEIHDAVGDENIVIFGMTTPEVNELKSKGYVPMNFYNNNAELRNVIDFINRGFCGKQFPEISGTIVYHDPYMVLADFADYRQAQNRIDELWADRTRWNSMSLMNTACSCRFAADRAVNEYAKNIWHTVPAK